MNSKTYWFNPGLYTRFVSMKPYFGILLFIVALACLPLACSKQPTYTKFSGVGTCGNGIQDRGEVGIDCGGDCTNTCTNIRYLEGEIFRRWSLNPYYQYVVTGPFIIRDKASLEIPAGTRLKVQADTGAYIAVMQGGSIFAWGTAKQPITITSNAPNPKPGDWGGLIICGQAPIDDTAPQLSPLGYYFFGGDQQFDSSGYLKYVKIEYAGATYDSLQNFNALSFYGTGAYTSVDHLWIDKSLGTGVEINGGTMPLSALYVAAGTDGVRVNGNWQAKGSQWYLDTNEQNGITFSNPNVLQSQSSTPTMLHQITVKNAGQSGLFFSNQPQSIHLSSVLIDNVTLGLEFSLHQEENQWIDKLSLEDIFIVNSQNLSNQNFYTDLLNTQNSAVPFSLKQIPEWIEKWPDN